MTQNLALDGGITLTPADSDVTTLRDFPASANLPAGSTETSVYDSPQIYTGNSEDVDSYNNKYGNLYNWNAATATVGVQAYVGIVYESICPKGWRLPNSGTSVGDKTYPNLFVGYGLPANNTQNVLAYITQVQQDPLGMPLAGHYSNGYNYGGQMGKYWTRLATTSNTVQQVSIDTIKNYFYPNNGGNHKQDAYSVRCVYGEESANIMQNFTAANCTALTESTASAPVRKVLQDSRDGKLYNISKLKDGECWMNQNLALDGGITLHIADSNVDQDRNIPASANLPYGSTTASQYNSPQIYIGHANTKDQYGSYYGNLYNWNAATATVGTDENTTTPTESICPKNWILPGLNHWSSLFSAYGLPMSGDITGSIIEMQQSPINMPLAGTYNSVAMFMGEMGHYQMKTASELADSALATRFGNNSSESVTFQTVYISLKKLGKSVRCVFGS